MSSLYRQSSRILRCRTSSSFPLVLIARESSQAFSRTTAHRSAYCSHFHRAVSSSSALPSALLRATKEPESPSEKQDAKEDKDSSTKPDETPPSGKKPDKETGHVVQAVDHLDLLAAPLRHVGHCLTLGFVNLMIPLEWNRIEFLEGSAQAIRSVHEMLGKKDWDGLQELLTADLLEELKKGEGSQSTEKEGWSDSPKILEANGLSIFRSSVRPPKSENDRPAIIVTPLVQLLEEYRFTEHDEPVKVRRLVKWEFERQLSQDAPPSPWQVSSLGEKWFCSGFKWK